MQYFMVSREVALLPFSLYLLGLAMGPIIAAPVSETFGRKPVYLSALPLFAFFTIGAGFSSGIVSLTVCRFFAGLFSSPGLSIGTGTISDVWPPEKRGAPMSTFVSMVQMGPAFGPLIGGFVTETRSWRWTQWVMLFGMAIVIGITIPMSETYKAKILKTRAKKYGLESPKQDFGDSFVKYFLRKTIIRPLHMLFTEPIVTFFDIYIAFNFGLLNAFFAAFSWVFMTVYGFNLGATGLTYLGQAVGTWIGLAVIIYVYKAVWVKMSRAAKEKGEKLPPEHRLFIAKIGAPFMPVS